MVFRLSKWISSNPEGNFALKTHLICPETQFSQTPGGAVAPLDPLGNMPMNSQGTHKCDLTNLYHAELGVRLQNDVAVK